MTTSPQIRHEIDVYRARTIARTVAADAGLDEHGALSVATAVSELAWNLVDHATDGGTLRVERVERVGRTDGDGVCVCVDDDGPGIADLPAALTDGIGQGLGCGLSGARRLMHEFTIQSAPGWGTRIRTVRWRSE